MFLLRKNNFRSNDEFIRELVFYLNEFSSSGKASKIIDTMEFCLKNIFSSDKVSCKLFQKFRELCLKYKTQIDVPLRRIVFLAKKTGFSSTYIKNISKINKDILDEIEKFRTEDDIAKCDRALIIGIKINLKILDSTINSLFEDVRRSFNTDVEEIFKTVMREYVKNKDFNVEININCFKLSKNSVFIPKKDLKNILIDLMSFVRFSLSASMSSKVNIDISSGRKNVNALFSIPGKMDGSLMKKKQECFSNCLPVIENFGGFLSIEDSCKNNEIDIQLILKTI